ncbi:MAG TPA: alpha/beta hydrolase, partial [Aestuariivirga sp.]|nr:alpha/beta hydrolase [Aestuariivirga sp.]
MSLLVKTALVGLLAYAGIMLAMYLLQRSLQYHPESKGLTPAAVGLSGVTVNLLDTPDGERIVTWYAPAMPGRPTVLYFQGNAGEIGDRPKRFQYYRDRGLGVLYVSYRGYGGSTGHISEAGLVTDAMVSYDWLLGQGVAPKQIAVVGESLGTGVAVQLAAQKPVGAVVLEAPYTSTADIAAAIYGWLPVRLLMKDQFRSADY